MRNGVLLMAAFSAWLIGSPVLAAEAATQVSAELARQCSEAYHKEDLTFVYQNCPEEAWALARAQCERGDETVSERFKAFCHLFKTGQAPIYGR